MNHRSIIVKTIVLVLAALVISGCGGAEGRKAKYLERGKSYLEQHNYDKAIVELKNVLQIDPKYAEAYYLLGKIEESRANWQKAFGDYSKAVELDPDHAAAQASLGRFYLLSGDVAKAEEIEQKILAKKPDHPEGKTLKAAILFSKKDVNGAVKLVQEVISADPTQVSTIAFLVDIYVQQKQQNKALGVLEKSVVDNPQSASLRLMLSRLYFQLKNFDKSEEQLKALVELDPKNLPYQVSLVTFYRQTKQLDKAENILKELIKKDPKDVQRHLLLAEFLAKEKGIDKAEKQLLASLDEYPKMHELRFNLAALYEKGNKPASAEEQYRKIIDAKGMDPLGLRARVLLADLMLTQGKAVEEPDKLIGEVLKENPTDNDALLTQGKLLLAKGKSQDAVTAFRTILKDQPNSRDVLILLGNAYMFNGEIELARETFKKTVEANPKDVKAHVALAQFLSNSKDYDGAIKSLDEAIKLDPKQIDVYIAKANIQFAKKDLKGTEKTLITIKSTHPDSPVGFFKMGQLYAEQKKHVEAMREFEHALKLSPASSEILTTLVNVDLARNKPDMAIRRLNDILEKTPNYILAHKLLADVYQQQKQYQKAENELRLTIGINPKWNVPYLTLAAIDMKQNDVPNALKAIDEGLRAIPDDLSLLLLLASIQEENQAYDKAMETYGGVLKKYPDNAVAVNNLASLLIEHKNDKASLAQAKTLAAKLENIRQPIFQDTRGWLYYKTGETDKAVEILKDVVQQAPNITIFHHHLGMAYYTQGNLPAAKTELAKAVEDKNDYPGKEEARAALQKIP